MLKILNGDFFKVLTVFRKLENQKMFEQQVRNSFEKRISGKYDQIAKGALLSNPGELVKKANEMIFNRSDSLPKEMPKSEQESKTIETEEQSINDEVVNSTSAVVVQKLQNNAARIKEIRGKLMGINDVMHQLMNIVFEQDTILAEIVNQAKETVTTVQQANKQLVAAGDHAKTFGSLWAIFFGTLALLLFFFDLIKS